MNSLFDVTDEAIALTSPYVFNDLISRLLRAEGSRSGVPQTRIHTTTRIGVSDGGVDARVESPVGTSWIPAGLSVWQFKSGAVPTDAMLRKEFEKPAVQQALADGGVYRVVVSARQNDKERLAKLKVIHICCRKNNIDTARVEFWAADKLAEWAKNHTALRLLFPGPLPGGLYRWEHWARNPRFAQPFKSNQQRSDIMIELRRGLAAIGGPVRAGIQGLAGIGKSRLGLEALRAVDSDDGLPERVLYAENLRAIPEGLFHWMEANTQAELILAVDECEGQEAEHLEMQALRSNGRLRVITIGQAREVRLFDPGRPHTFLLDKLDDEAMRDLLKTATPGLDDSRYTFAVSVASGFVKIAIRLAEAMLRNPEMVSARDLALDYDVRDVVKQFLVPDETDLRVMRALALMSRVGWEGELEQEGQVVIKYLGLDWHDAKSRVRRLTDEGIVAKQGRYRYVTPHILAVWLASEVWDDYGEETILVLKDLPSPTSGRAFLERLRDIGDDPRARQVCEMMLDPSGLFPNITSINEEGHSQVFALLGEAHPKAGLLALQRLLDGLPRSELMQFKSGRRQIVWLLEKLAWLPETFMGAARLLLLLAEAENEAWANNAGGVWVGLFGTHLGNTSVSALERHTLIEEALDHDSVERQLLAVRAITRIFAIQEIGSVTGETQGGRVAPPRWRPSTWEEDRQVRLSGLTLLDQALVSEYDAVRAAAWKVLLDDAREIVALGLADELMNRIEGRVPTDYEERRRILQALEGVLDFEQSRANSEQTIRLLALCQTLAGSSYGERLRLWTGDQTHRVRRNLEESIHNWVDRQARERELMSASLADEGILHPDLLRAEWNWLGTAPFTFFFSKRLGELDVERQFWGDIEALVRSDQGYVLAAGYLEGQSVTGRDWREEVLDRWSQKPEMALAVLDLTWRGGSGDADARRVIGLVERGWVQGARLGMFAMSTLPQRVSTDVFLSLIQAVLSDPSGGGSSNAALLISQRLNSHPEDHSVLAPMVWAVLEGPNAFIGQQGYQTMDLVSSYVADNPIRVARAVLKLFERESPPLLRESPQINLLEQATPRDPQGVWAEVEPWLSGIRENAGSVALYLCLQGWYGQCVGADVLIPWAKANMPDGPSLVAAMTAVKAAPLHLIEQGERPEGALQPGPLDTLVRELLIHFQDDQAVGSALAGNFTSGTFWGGFSQWLRAHLEIASKWLDDPAPAVRTWTRQLIDSLQKQIDAANVQEEEGFF